MHLTIPHVPHLGYIVAALAVVAYTAVVWWVCHPFVKALIRPPRRRQP